MVQMVADLGGTAAVIMQTLFASLAGSGLPLPASLWDAESGVELFADPEDARGLGLSGLAYQYIGGLIAHAPALAAVTCPTVNSYKRFGVGAPNSRATWAPPHATYGGEQRSPKSRA